MYKKYKLVDSDFRVYASSNFIIILKIIRYFIEDKYTSFGLFIKDENGRRVA